MKRVLVAAVVLFGMQATASAQLGGLGNKAKGLVKGTVDKVARTQKEKADKKVKEVSQKAKQKAVDKVLGSVGRPDCPWTMSAESFYNGNDRSNPKNINTYIWNLENVSDEEVQALRDQMDARLKSNYKLLKAQAEGLITSNNPLFDECLKAKEEISRWDTFYGALAQMFYICVSGIRVEDGGIMGVADAKYLVHHNGGGGLGAYAVGTINGDCKFVDVLSSGGDKYLDDEKIEWANRAVKRMRKVQILGYNIRGLATEVGMQIKGTDYLPVLYNLAGMYAGVTEKAIANNKPENIERKARPAAGALHASLKAKALAVAKAQDSSVTDVIITSKAWDVKRKGAVITHRSVYGYYLVKDKLGTKCVPRAWTQDYKGGGKYGALRAGGVGTTAEFYVK